MHSYAFLCLQVSHEDPLQPVVLGGLHLGAAHLRGNAGEVLGLDAAVPVAQLRVLILLHGGHLLDLLRGLAAGDDALVELLENGVAVVNWNTNLCRIMRINASWSECIRMQLICMHWNARKCITFRMHPYGNAHECIIGRMHRNATHVHALKCVYMHHVQNAYIR